jgi:diguanylate cyclase (GGDEF)-like protein
VFTAETTKTRGRILIVEDEVFLQTILKYELEDAGYEVCVAGDGLEGLKAVEDRIPDLILMDVMMPGADGNEVCRRLKSAPRTRQIPIIMLTAMATPEDKIRSLDQGANDYVTKPFERKELLKRVENLLDWGRIQRDSNPLTGLPGNNSIETELNRRLASGQPFVFMYVDVDNFKPFNDFYSYQKGDQAIRLLALLLQRVVDGAGDCSRCDFVGHVGGDDFVVMASAERAPSIAEEIVRRFDAEIPELYSKTDRARGYTQVLNRKGELERYSLMTVTVAAVVADGNSYSHIAQISDVAAELKHHGKQQIGSVIVWDRRDGLAARRGEPNAEVDSGP